ncbi:MAG: VOC family protein [Acidimicrobiales bacterium]
MHRSRLTAIAVDVSAESHEATIGFWAGAVGGEIQRDDPDDPYVTVGHPRGLEMFVQRVDAEPRIHLDVETDDVDAEVARLEALGATRVEKVKTWWVMRDPAGLLFCVVRPQSDDFPRDAVTWGD